MNHSVCKSMFPVARRILAGALLLLLCLPGFSQQPAAADARTARIDAYLQEEMQKLHIPGLALAIVRDGQILYQKGYGLANLEHGVPVRVETVFQSGSTGKQYTAMAVLMLAEEGKLALDDSIRRHFPDAPAAWQPITIRHLLTHTSGLGDYTEPIDMRMDHTEEELRKIVFRQKSSFKPGEKFRYSNLGYVTLGLLIGKVSGKFYGDFLQERIFRPLGMTTARIIDEAAIVPHRAAGYVWAKGGWRNQGWVSPTFNSTADGSLYLTLADVAKWDGALSGGKLVGKGSYDQAWTPARLNDGSATGYGFGWSVTAMNGHRLIEHGGAWQGFMAMISRYVDDHLTVILFANLIGTPVERLTHAVAGLWEPALAPPEPKAVEDKEPAVTAKFRRCIEELAAGTCKAEYFTTGFAAEIFPDGAAQLKEYLGGLGAIAAMELAQRRDADGLRVYVYRVRMGETWLRFQFSLDRADRISTMGIRPE